MSRSVRLGMVFTAFVAAALVVIESQAQPPDAKPAPNGGPGGGPGGPGGGRGRFNPGRMRLFRNVDPALMMLNSDQVQKELELDADQKSKLNDLRTKVREEMQKEFQELDELSPEEQAAKELELAEKLKTRSAEMRKEVDEILLPQQVERLNQISLQMQMRMGGAGALGSSSLLAQLQLTDSQKDQLLKIKQKYEAAREALFPRPDPNASQEQRRAAFTGMREKMEKLGKDATDEVMAVLTTEQKATLEKLKGKPFEFQFGRGGPGGRRGGPGGPGGGPGGPPPGGNPPPAGGSN